MARTTTVTHPDGTVSKRTSKNAVYTYAVVLTETGADRATRARDYAESQVKAAFRSEGDLALDALRVQDTAWPKGETYREVFLGRTFIDSFNVQRPRRGEVTLAEAQQKVAANLARQRESAALFFRQADREAASEPTYSVLRWSSRADLAAKAAAGEFARLARNGSTVTVVAVDGGE